MAEDKPWNLTTGETMGRIRAYKNFKFLSGNKLNNFILVSAVVSLILELFPLKSSGSIFTTNDMAYIILLSSIIYQCAPQYY